MTTLKPFLYDWFGGNVWLFHVINDTDGGPQYDRFMVAGSQLGYYGHFWFYLMFAAIWAIVAIAYTRARKPGNYTFVRDQWVIALLVLVATFEFNHLWVSGLKDFFHYERPFLILPADHMRLVTMDVDPKEYARSFPSGHAIFAMMMVAGLWPVAGELGQIALMAFLTWVCWSRVALGMHFPADVIGGALISLAVVHIIRKLVVRVCDVIKVRATGNRLQKH